jgi:hypothetical protein
MVMSMRRVLRALAVLWVCGAALLAAGGASAAASPTPPYPPVTPPSVSVSTTSPCVGVTIDVGGAGFTGGEAVALSVGGHVSGSATVGAAGSFTATVNTPAVTGQQVLSVVGRSSGLIATAGLRVSNCSGVSGASSGRGLAFTGVQAAGLCVAGVVLLGGGLLVAAAGRRRKSAVGA